MWVLDHLDDIASDLSAIHRIDDMYALSSRRFFRLAYRLPAYRGVMRMRVEAAQAEGPAGHGPARSGEVPTRISDAELHYSGAYAGLVEWGRG